MIYSTDNTDRAVIAAYQRGWNEAQDWSKPHLNPYQRNTREWVAYDQGREEGGLSSYEASRRLVTSLQR